MSSAEEHLQKLMKVGDLLFFRVRLFLFPPLTRRVRVVHSLTRGTRRRRAKLRQRFVVVALRFVALRCRGAV
jgi:hypothetical protein